MTSVRIFQSLLVVFIAAIVASTGYAFAASNTVPPAAGGDGASSVSGYVISDVSYSLDASDPARLDTVSFTLNAAARTVRVKLTEAGSTWYDCAALSNDQWSCNTFGAATVSIDQLRVTASSN